MEVQQVREMLLAGPPEEVLQKLRAMMVNFEILPELQQRAINSILPVPFVPGQVSFDPVPHTHSVPSEEPLRSKNELCIAAYNGNLQKVQQLVDRGVDVNNYQNLPPADTPLMEACLGNKLEVAKYLLQKGASVLETNVDQWLPIHIAVREGSLEMARILLEKKSPVDAKGLEGVTSLNIAVSRANLEMVQLLLDEGLASVTEHAGHTSLHYAVEKDSIQIAKMLLEKGCPPDPKDITGSTPLMIAALSKNEEMVRLLLEVGKASVSAKEQFNTMPIHIAAQVGSVPIAKLLLEHGSPVEEKKIRGYTPLLVAVWHKKFEMVKLLLEVGGASVATGDVMGYLPVHIAAHEGMEDIVQILLDRDSEIQVHARTFNNSCTPLHLASKEGNTNICRLLIEHGSHVSTTDSSNMTSLMLAAQKGHLSTVEYLLQLECNHTAQNVYGETALFAPACFGYTDVIAAMLPHFEIEDLNFEDENRNTVVFRAAMFAEFEAMDMLLKKGGDELWKSSRFTILHSLASCPDGRLTQAHCARFSTLSDIPSAKGFTPAQTALRMSSIRNFMTLVQAFPRIIQNESLQLMKLALQHAHVDIVNYIQRKTNVLDNNGFSWSNILSGSSGKSESRHQILLSYNAFFKVETPAQIREAIAKAIQNNHFTVFKVLISWIKNFSDLECIWPLWSAADIDNESITKHLLELDPIFQAQLGPDGTLPLYVCLERKHLNMISAWTEVNPNEVKILTHTLEEKDPVKATDQQYFNDLLISGQWFENEFIVQCKTYPIFNEDCSAPFTVRQQYDQKLSLLYDIAPDMIDIRDCLPSKGDVTRKCCGHIRKENSLGCNILSDLLISVYQIERELKDIGNIMHLLSPDFILIGSISEGTRLGHPDELDMTTTFNQLKASFFELNPTNALGLKLSKEGLRFFNEIQNKDQFQELNLPNLVRKDSFLNMISFQGMFLKSLEKVVTAINLPDNIHLGTTNSAFDVTSCNECVLASKEEGTWKHCKTCFPLLAQTKKGIVLNLIWKNEHVEYKCSIDLVPLFKVPEKDLSKLFGCVASTLLEQKPPGWKAALEKNIQVNRPTLVGFRDMAKMSPNCLLVGLKALYYNCADNNYMIAPGQTTGTLHFDSRRIREAYVFTKGLVKLLKLPIKSYFLKKIFLCEEMIEFSETTRSNQHFILSILSRPEFGTRFIDKLDMRKMEDIGNRKHSQELEVILK